MPAKQVQQSTFDSIVREGIQDFGLTPQEAVSDACEQLKKIGISDFTNLDISAPSETILETHLSDSHLTLIRNGLKTRDTSVLLDSISGLSLELEDKREVAWAVENGIIELLARILDLVLQSRDEDNHLLIIHVCDVIVKFCGVDEMNRSLFVTLTEVDGVECLTLLFRKLAEDREPNFDLRTCLSVTNAMISIQRQNEKVKARFASGTSLDCLLKHIEYASRILQDQENESGHDIAAKLLLRLCLFTRQLLAPDDTTVVIAETFNRARVLAGVKVVTESGLQPLTHTMNMLQLVSDVMGQLESKSFVSTLVRRHMITECIMCARACAVSDEICSQIIKLKLHDKALDFQDEFLDDESTATACLALVRNVAALDESKTSIFERLDVISQAAKQHFRTCSKVAEQYCGLLSTLCLRRPDLARKAVHGGFLDMVLEAMDVHASNKNVQRIGCHVIRNICARDGEARQVLTRSGSVEKLIRKAWERHSKALDDVAYAALRDMDVLKDSELRRDERYTMPAGFYNTPTVRDKV